MGIFFAMTKHEIVELITKDKAYEAYCKRVCNGKDIYKDLYQYIILTILEKEESKIVGLHERGEIKLYISRIIWLSVNSKNSEFYQKYISGEWDELNINISEEEAEGDFERFMDGFNEKLDVECNRCETDGIYPTSVKIYEAYTLEGSYTKTAKRLNIPINTIHRHVANTRDLILKSLNEDTDRHTA